MTELRSLDDLIAERGPFTVRDSIGWATRVVKMLAEVHNMGHVHGALCAEAILVAGEDCSSQGFVLHPQDVEQPLAYRSREAAARDVDLYPDDVWALCVTFYLMMTKHLPFEQGVAAWCAAGRTNVPPMAPHGPHLQVMQLMMDQLLNPAVEEAERYTAADLVQLFCDFSPATASLSRFRLRHPASSEAPPVDMEREAPARTHPWRLLAWVLVGVLVGGVVIAAALLLVLR